MSAGRRGRAPRRCVQAFLHVAAGAMCTTPHELVNELAEAMLERLPRGHAVLVPSRGPIHCGAEGVK